MAPSISRVRSSFFEGETLSVPLFLRRCPAPSPVEPSAAGHPNGPRLSTFIPGTVVQGSRDSIGIGRFFTRIHYGFVLARFPVVFTTRHHVTPWTLAGHGRGRRYRMGDHGTTFIGCSLGAIPLLAGFVFSAHRWPGKPRRSCAARSPRLTEQSSRLCQRTGVGLSSPVEGHDGKSAFH
jgi:hypothetical protein